MRIERLQNMPEPDDTAEAVRFRRIRLILHTVLSFLHVNVIHKWPPQLI